MTLFSALGKNQRERSTRLESSDSTNRETDSHVGGRQTEPEQCASLPTRPGHRHVKGALHRHVKAALHRGVLEDHAAKRNAGTKSFTML